MDDLNFYDKINYAGSWITNNQALVVHYTLNVISASMVIIAGFILSRTIQRVFKKFTQVRNIDITVAEFLSLMIRYGIVIFTFITALGCMGVETTSVIAVIGAAGLAVGLALQGSLSNFAAGVLLVSLRYFKTGDFVDFGGTSGTVISVQIFATKLRSFDGKIVVIPNNKILSSNITNFSEEPNRLIETNIRVKYLNDIDLIKKIVTDIILEDNRILHEKGMTVRLKSMNELTLEFIIRIWVPRYDIQNVSFDLLEKIKTNFDKNNIGLSK